MAVASSDGGNLLSVASVNPVNGGRKPLCNAVFNVDNAGEKSAACVNATSSAGVLVCLLIAGAAWCVVSEAVVCWVPPSAVVFNVSGGKVHKPCALHGHVMLLPFGCLMVHCCLSNVTVHHDGIMVLQLGGSCVGVGTHVLFWPLLGFPGWVVLLCVLSACAVGSQPVLLWVWLPVARCGVVMLW